MFRLRVCKCVSQLRRHEELARQRSPRARAALLPTALSRGLLGSRLQSTLARGLMPPARKVMTHTYILRGYTPAARPPSPRPAVSVSAVARLFRLARSRHTLRGWLRYRVALLFAPDPVYRAFVYQARHRYYSQTECR